MAFSGRFETTTRRFELEEVIEDDGGSGDEYDSDDSECDPSYTIVEETNSKLSRPSIKRIPKPSKVADMELIDIDDVAPNTLNENDEKDIDEVLQIIKAGKLEKLKVEQCKVYLRKNGLRLTGTKDILIRRINEHLEILNGGEKKYPESSFILNCKGDACMGDVVMFEQNVYEMFNIASRSSIGPSCGTRTVAGRIVKESYGASKQQHTFTIEVLWSKGEKPLPPLHPLLIKGRNLYRMKTLRQRWEDEGERQKVLMEKHGRGSLARSNREVRVLEKEKRKKLQEIRISRSNRFSDNPSQSNLTSTAGSVLAESMVSLSVGPSKVGVQHHQQGPLFGNSGNLLQSQQSENRTMQTKSDLLIDQRKRPFQLQYMDSMQANYCSQPQMRVVPPASYNKQQPSIDRADHPAFINKALNHASLDYYRLTLGKMNPYPTVNQPAQECYKQRLTLGKMNPYPTVNQPAQECYKQQRCRHFAKGRCYFGENCKFLHDMTQESVLPHEHRRHYMH